MVAVEKGNPLIRYAGIQNFTRCPRARRFEKVYACTDLEVVPGEKEVIEGSMVTVLHRRSIKSPITKATYEALIKTCTHCPLFPDSV
jgi:hypothetical protein